MHLHHFLGRGLLDLFTPIDGGRQPIAVNQPGGAGTVYPFTRESDLNTVIADAYLYSVGDGCKFSMPYRIAWMRGFGTELVWTPIDAVHAQDVLIVDADGREIFDTREADLFSARDWGDRLRVYEWQMQDPERVLRLVQHTAVPLDEEATNFPQYYEPTFAEFDSRVIEFIRPRLRSLRVDVGDGLQEKLIVANGYNMKLSTEFTPGPIGGRNSTAIIFDAVAGAGKGKFDPGCSDDPVLRMINGVRADDRGNINLGGTDCYRVERPVHDILDDLSGSLALVNHTLQILNDCEACCSCDNFINTYEGIRRLRDRYAEMVAKAQNVRDMYAANVARWNEQRACRLAQSLQVAVQPGCSDDVQFAIGFCNHSDECIENVIVVVSFQYADEAGDIDPQTNQPFEANTVYSGEGDPGLVCGSSMRSGNFEANPLRGFSRNQPTPYPSRGSYPYFYAVWDKITASTMGSYLFQMSFPDSEPSDLVEVIIDAYSVPNDVPVPVGSDSPIPGYVFGSGPMTEEAKSYRIATIRKISSGLLQSNCCE